MGDKEHNFDTLNEKRAWDIEEYTDAQTFGEGKHNVKYKFKLKVPEGMEYRITVEARVYAKEVEV